jgi:hypothetical protein
MELKTFLTQNRRAILSRWLDHILKTYPADAARFMRQNPNQFSNPVGHTYIAEIETLFDALLGEAAEDAVGDSLERINKIRAVQDFSASRAVSYIFLIKTAIREEITREEHDKRMTADLLALETKIDGMALTAFDSYMRCREKLFEIKCKDIRRRMSPFGGPDNEESKNRL